MPGYTLYSTGLFLYNLFFSLKVMYTSVVSASVYMRHDFEVRHLKSWKRGVDSYELPCGLWESTPRPL